MSFTASAQWDDAAALAIARKVAWRQRRLFAAYPAAGIEDLQQHALLACMEADGSWRPGGASWANHLYRCAWRRLVDYSRRLESQRRRETEADEQQSEEQQSELVELVALAAHAARAARSRGYAVRTLANTRRGYPWGGGYPGGRPGYPLSTLAACLAVKQRLRASWEGLRRALVGMDELRAELGLVRVPAATTLFRAEQRLRKLTRRLAQSN